MTFAQWSTSLTRRLANSTGVLLSERPWATFAKGKPVTDRQVARMLGKYRIKSDDVRPNGVHAKGYQRTRFEDVWARYLPKTSPPAAQGASSRASVQTSMEWA